MEGYLPTAQAIECAEVAASDVEGKRRWHTVRPGMSLGLVEMQLDSPLVYQSRTFPALCLSVVLEGYATNLMEGVEGGFCPDEMWISSIGECVPTATTLLPHRPIRVVELLLTPDWVSANQDSLCQDPVFSLMARAMTEPIAVRRCPLDSRLRQIAWHALEPQGPGAFTQYHLDACALSMFGILTEHFQAARAHPGITAMPSRAQRRLLEVRRCIDADPGAVASVAQLATRFATSQSALKRDFQQAFGTSVRDYLLSRRMQVGRNAIIRDRLTVAEAAYKVGYDHPANFTAAFRRHFGYPPSRLK